MAFPQHAHHIGATEGHFLRALHEGHARVGTGKVLTAAEIVPRIRHHTVTTGHVATAAGVAVGHGWAEASGGGWRLTRAGNKIARKWRPRLTRA